jgi:hypothetical protein
LGPNGKKRANFLLFPFAICFCYFLFAIGCLGPNGKKRAIFFSICPFAKGSKQALKDARLFIFSEAVDGSHQGFSISFGWRLESSI